MKATKMRAGTNEVVGFLRWYDTASHEGIRFAVVVRSAGPFIGYDYQIL